MADEQHSDSYHRSGLRDYLYRLANGHWPDYN